MEKSEKIHTLISTIHAVFISYNSAQFFFNNIDNNYFRSTLLISMTYFIIDLFYLLSTINNRNKTHIIQMIIHHVMPICILSARYLFGFIYHELFDYIMSFLFISEITTLPLNICWYLNKQSKTNNILFKTSALSLLILYIPFRIINNTYMLCVIIYNREYIYLLPQIILTFLNYIWYYKLIKKFKKE